MLYLIFQYWWKPVLSNTEKIFLLINLYLLLSSLTVSSRLVGLSGFVSPFSGAELSGSVSSSSFSPRIALLTCGNVKSQIRTVKRLWMWNNQHKNIFFSKWKYLEVLYFLPNLNKTDEKNEKTDTKSQNLMRQFFVWKLLF